MKRWTVLSLLTVALCGCGDQDGDDVAEVKKPMPMDQVPAVVLKAAKEAAPNLTFFAAYAGKYDGKDAIELKGKTKSGQIKELELSPDGKVLGTE